MKYFTRECHPNGIYIFFPAVLLLFLAVSWIPDEKTSPLFLNDPVQFAIPGNFVSPFDNLNNIPASGLDVDLDGNTDIVEPCSCRSQLPVPNGTNPNNGWFDDQVIVATGISGQEWRIKNSDNLFKPSNFQPISNGAIIPEVGNTGVYVLPVIHRDANTYIASVEAPSAYPGQEFGPVINTCYYPDPLIENLQDSYCDTDPNVVLLGSVTSDYDDNFLPLLPLSEFWTVTRLENGQTSVGTVFSPQSLGPGTYVVRYTVDLGPTPNSNFHKTGCTLTAEKQVLIRAAHIMACNSSINVTLPAAACAVTIVPDMLLAVDPDESAMFQIDVIALNGESLGDVIPASFAGIPLDVRIEDLCSGDYCFSTVTAGDFAAPQLNIPADITLACYEDPDTALTGVATASDCSPHSVSFSDQTIDNACGNPVRQVLRSWQATDSFGNTSSAVQTISIAKYHISDLVFPPDTVYSCEAYQSDPGIIGATASGAGEPSMIDDPLCGLIYSYSDNTIALCGDPSTSFLILRTWTVIDNCSNTIITTDGNGNDNVQTIRVQDDEPPVITAAPVQAVATLSPLDNGLAGCSSVGFIPPPEGNDGCNDFTIRIFTPLGEADYVNGADGAQGGYIPAPGLQLGDHALSYEVTDACGNQSTAEAILTVVDELPPVMICDNAISVTLTSDGSGRVFPADIDEGSRDECCISLSMVKLENEADVLFRNYIDLDCQDDTLQVVLRVWDCAGNFNDCVSTVMVDDPVSVTVEQGVSPVSLNCTQDYSDYLMEDFDAPVFVDNCGYSVSFEVEESLDSCGIGVLTRTWTAQDHPGNPPVIVEQLISLEPLFDYQVSLPEDAWASCPDIVYEELTFQSQGCDRVSWTVGEATISLGSDSACYRIIRTYDILNECEYDGSSPPVQIPSWDSDDPDELEGDAYVFRSDGLNIYRLLPGGTEELIGPSTGYYQYRQMVYVLDDSPPAVSFEPLQPLCAQEAGNCSAALSFSFVAEDNCAGALTVSHLLVSPGSSPVLDPYGTLEYAGGNDYIISGNYPAGAHQFELSIVDDCGNTTTASVPFNVSDCTPPLLECDQGLSFNLSSGEELVLQAADLVEAVSDNCSDFLLSFSPDSLLESLVFNCDAVGDQLVQLWATDESGNQSDCMVEVNLQDAGGCINYFVVDGQLRTETGQPVNNASVFLNGSVSMQDTTMADGWYAFAEVPQASTFKVEPEKNTGHNNGLSTLDLIQINKHILNVEPLDSPYKIIAADVNRSGNVSVLDLIQIRKIILNIDTAFQSNTSWRFVPESYSFSDPSNPFLEDFTNDLTIMDLQNDTTVYFVGIKVGDVNNSANPGNLEQLEERGPAEPLVLKTSLAEIRRGETVLLQFESQAEAMQGLQGTLHFDPDKLAFVSVVESPHFAADNLGRTRENDGILTFSCHNDEVGKKGFALRFRGKEDLLLEDVLHLRSDFTTAEGYIYNKNGELETRILRLMFPQSLNIVKFVLYPNQPDPFDSYTSIPFFLRESSQVTFDIWDPNGRQLEGFIHHYGPGDHEIRLQATDIPVKGLLIYRIKTDFGTFTGKMIKTSR